jgi:pimeloyl-ACP methyl ester carboxylesterase
VVVAGSSRRRGAHAGSRGSGRALVWLAATLGVTEPVPAVAPVPRVVTLPARRATRAVALVLPGGRADSFEPAEARHLSAARMWPIARALHRGGRDDGLAVWLLRYRYRGWNGEEMSPVADTRWALDEVRRQHGHLPVVLAGHSMGGRTALRVADDELVRGVVALAPWLLDGEPVDQLAGRRILIVHGTRDRVTSPRASRRYADLARAVTDDINYVAIRGESHAMLLRPRTWNRLTMQFALDVVRKAATN